MTDLGNALQWDDEISKEAEFEILPEGEYDFTVTAMERERFEGSEKMSACHVASLTIEVSRDNKTGKIYEKLYLNSKAEWKLSQFFIAIGQKKKGEPLKPNWTQVPGSTGRLKLRIEKYTDRNGQQRESNRVDAFLPKESRKITPGVF